MKSQVVAFAFAFAAVLVALPATGADEQVSIRLLIDGVAVIDIKLANPRRSATLAKHAALLSAFEAACNAPRGEANQGAFIAALRDQLGKDYRMKSEALWKKVVDDSQPGQRASVTTEAQVGRDSFSCSTMRSQGG